MWDSDMSDLTPLEDSDEDSEVEQQATVVEGKTPVVVKAQSSVCARSKCQNLLQPSSKWKMCALCRLKFRDRSRERRAGDDRATVPAGTNEVCVGWNSSIPMLIRSFIGCRAGNAPVRLAHLQEAPASGVPVEAL